MNDKGKQDYLQVFGNYVKYLRQKNGWSQEELATRCGYTSDSRKSTIHKIEVGKSDLPASKIRKLADVFGVSPCDLIDPPSSARDEMMVCELFERCHGQEAYRMVQSFLKLDQADRLVIYGRILGMLDTEKYADKKDIVSLNA